MRDRTNVNEIYMKDIYFEEMCEIEKEKEELLYKSMFYKVLLTDIKKIFIELGFTQTQKVNNEKEIIDVKIHYKDDFDIKSFSCVNISKIEKFDKIIFRNIPDDRIKNTLSTTDVRNKIQRYFTSTFQLLNLYIRKVLREEKYDFEELKNQMSKAFQYVDNPNEEFEEE